MNFFSPKKYKTNIFGILLITRFEGYMPEPYQDIAGIWTVGYGNTHYPNGNAVSENDGSISRYEAEFMLIKTIREFEIRLADFLIVNDIKLNSNEFSALLSFVYNLGMGVVTQENRSMHKALISGNRDVIADTFLLYNKAKVNGEYKIISGLVRRREAERELFLTKPIHDRVDYVSY